MQRKTRSRQPEKIRDTMRGGGEKPSPKAALVLTTF